MTFPEEPVEGKKVGNRFFGLFGAGGHRLEFVAVAQLLHEGQEPVDFFLQRHPVRFSFTFGLLGPFLGGHRALFPTGGCFVDLPYLDVLPFNLLP